MSRLTVPLMIIVGFGVLVFVHEFGHFLVAKLFKIRVHEFFLGFGPKLISGQRGETRYGVAAIPLGGYVKLSGMEEEGELSPEDERRSFRAQAKWKRVLVILAGPTMNILFSIPLFFIVISSMPTIQGVTTTFAKVTKGSPAEKAGLRAGDRVVRVDGNPVRKFTDLQSAIKRDGKLPDKKIEVTVVRGGAEKTFVAVLHPKPDKAGQRQILLGVEAKAKLGPPPPPGEALVGSLQITWRVSSTLVRVIGGLFTGGTPLKQFTSTSAGPVGIVSILGEGASRGILDFMWLIAIIGPNLAVVNLFPLLPLDGGRVVIIAYEAITRRRLGRERIFAFQAFGLFLILALIVTLTFSDIGKLLRGESFLGG